MSLKPQNLPAIVTFFTSPAWADLLEQIEKAKPDYPPLTADALHTASQFRRREGFDLFRDALLAEAGVRSQEVKKPETPEDAAMRELKDSGQFINTERD